MTDDQFDEYLKTRYYPEIDWYTKRGNREKWCYMAFQWGLIILSASTPILIAVGDFRSALSNVTAGSPTGINVVQMCSISTAFLVAVFAAALKVFHFQENWLDFRATQEQLKTEIHFYFARLYGYKTAHDVRALFVSHVERIIRGEVKSWEARMQSAGSSNTEFLVDDIPPAHPSA